ncbi:MAG: transposase [Polaromonas sp.]|nr:transposase [Polaromonas sp.]
MSIVYLTLRMAQWCSQRSPLCGELEADESYFGPRRVRGKRGRGAGNKTIVFGLLKRGDQVYTEIVPDASKRTLQAIIRGKALSVINTDGWRYDGLRILALANTLGLIAATMSLSGSSHVNGIESF